MLTLEGSETEAPALVAESEAMRQILELVDRVASSDCCVLIEGESGTGKELVARRLHARSGRRDRPFIPVNCAGISEGVFESQFFGHVRGAFTGAEQTMLGLVRTAEGGTLLLDEVGEVPLNQQAKLLRFLQDGEVMPVGGTGPVRADVRVVAATNRDLRALVREGGFREDLFYRLNVVRVCLPPLRDRREDVLPLLEHFVAAQARADGSEPIEVPAAVRRQLREYDWPGNVRELSSWVQRARATGLPAHVLAASLAADGGGESRAGEAVTLAEAERRAIAVALDAAGDNRSEAARILDVHRGTLLRKMAQYDMA